jgi:hypothetical protein
MTQEELNEYSSYSYLCKNTIFITKISSNLLNKDILFQKRYLGQYGHINSINFVRNQKNNGKNIVVKFDTVNQAALCILSLQNFEVDENIKLEVRYFTTKYCYFYLLGKECQNNNCLFLHEKKINDNIYINIKPGEIIDSQKLALNILKISKRTFENVYNKLIKDNFYKIYNKFPKLTIKKLKGYISEKKNKFKNKENKNNNHNNKFFNNDNNNDNNSNNSNNSNNNSNDTYNDSNSNDISNNNIVINNKDNNFFINNLINKISLSFIFKKRFQHSRFDFVNRNVNNDDKIEIPEQILEFISNYLTLFCFNNLNNINDKNNDIQKYKYEFNINWNEFKHKIEKQFFCKIQ